MKLTNLIRFFPFILIVFHGVGLFLFLGSEDGVSLTWLNLLLCGVLIALEEGISIRNLILFLGIALGGYLIELIGTKTGYLFGDYAYLDTLGWSFLGVPLIIGVNWFAIVAASSNVIRNLTLNKWVLSLLSGLLCVLMDFVIELVAIRFEFWTWFGADIPLFNYFTWFVFATFFSYIYLKFSFKLNKTARWLYFVWILFFTLLTILTEF